MTAATVAALLAEARGAGVDRLDALLLLGRALGRSRTWLVAHDDAALSPAQSEAARAELARRAAGEPLAYLLGEKEFHGLMLRVDRRVLVPRPDTELLVDWALDCLGRELTDVTVPRVVDLGTGSGAIALAVKRAHPAAEVVATDANPDALAVAQHNAAAHGLDVRFELGHWWRPLGAERFDLALSNPPYIAADDAHLAALRHEPRSALTPGDDGLGALRNIVAGAACHLQPGGRLLLEHGFDQAEAVAALLRRHGFDTVETRADLAGRPRCTGGRRPA